MMTCHVELRCNCICCCVYEVVRSDKEVAQLERSETLKVDRGTFPGGLSLDPAVLFN